MKVIQGMFYMKLPDDFNGSIREAINLTLDRCETKPVINEGYDFSDTKERVSIAMSALWKEFLKAIGKGGKYSGNITLQTLGDDDTWTIEEQI